MPSEKPFKDYHVGQIIWEHASYSKDAWRASTIMSISNKDNGIMRVKHTIDGKLSTLYGNYYHSLAPHGAASLVPAKTVYLLGTKIGQEFNWRFHTNFEVYVCGTRMNNPGTTLGFLIIPTGGLYEAGDVYKHPAYKTWLVAPNLGELFSFLGNKLPEITEVYEKINGKEAADISDDNVQAT